MRVKSEKSATSMMGRFQAVLVALSMLLVCSFTVAAQQKVTGTVSDETGEPLAGVTVMVKGGTVGTSTNIDGQYSIDAPDQATLTFTYVGMNPVSKKLAAGQTKLDIVMKEDANTLDEVVVVGYGQQKKLTMTGAVAQVTSKDITKTVGTNLSQAMTGKLPGLISMQSTGRPGSDGVSFLVRGYSSYNDAGSVLTIIDGVDRGSRGLSEIDPNDVESISILKDAASCAIYGMKAANGVIIITTKKGSEGKANISYRGTMTLNHATAMPKMMNGTQYMQWYNLAQVMDGTDPSAVKYSPEMIEATYNGDLTDGIENTNWASPFDKTTLSTQHNLSVSGGTQKSRYFLSGGYMKQDGIMKGMNYQRGNFRSNVSAEIGNMFDLMFNVTGSVADSKDNSGHQMAQSGAVGGFNIENVLLYSLPFVPKNYYMCDPSDPMYGVPTGAFRNPSMNPEYSIGNSGFHKTRTISLNTAGRIDWKAPFLKGFKASFFFSWDWRNINSKTFSHTYQLMTYQHGSNTYSYGPAVNLSENGGLANGDQRMQQVVIRPSISYTNTFAGKHNVDILLLYEKTTNRSTSTDATSWNFQLFDLPYLNFADEIRPDGHHESAGYTAAEGYAGRFSYNYDEKYLAEFAFRYDGSYLFAPGNRYGFFPSGSLGWVMTKEDWVREFLGEKVDFLKLRGSIGLTGNDNVAAWKYRRMMNYNKNAMVFGTDPVAGPTLVPETKYLQYDLTWEKTLTYDIGAELTMWNGLLGVEFDWFYKYTYDILTGVGGAYAPSLAGNYPDVDSKGRFDNRGFELVLKHTNRIGEVNYNVNFNLSYAHNKILRRTESAGVLPWQSTLGSSIGAVIGYKTDGLFQTQEELDNAPRYQFASGQPKLGDIKFVDLNGDGVVDSKDQTYIGRGPRPELMFALNLDANWKGFDVSLQFQGAGLCDRMLAFYGVSGSTYVSDAGPLGRPFYAGVDNAPVFVVEQSWRPDNTDASYPRLTLAPFGGNYSKNDFWKRNGAYLRLKNASIGYTLPRKLTQKAGIENLRFFASGMNLFTVTDFKYIDPESGNYVWSFYPQQRTVTFGLDLSF